MTTRTNIVARTNRVRVAPSAGVATLRVLGDRVSALWNAANYECRQRFVRKEGVPGYSALCALMAKHETYRALPSDIAQEVLKKLAEAWKSFFVLRGEWAAGSVKNKPGLPTYRKNKDGSRPFDFIPVKCDRSYSVDVDVVSVTLPSDLREKAGARLLLPYRGRRRWVGKMGRAEFLYDRMRDRWYFVYAVEMAKPMPRPWARAAAIDLGVRVLASLSIEGVTDAFHFSGREALKDFDYWGRQLAVEQKRLADIGRKTSKRLSEMHRIRRLRLEHAWEALAARIVSICRFHKVATVYLGYPKNIRRDKNYGRWNEKIHTFWSFDLALRILEKHLSRARIQAIRVGERGSSSTCIHDLSGGREHHVVRAPRHLLTCKTCGTVLHSDQAGSRNILRFCKPSVRWDRLEASPRTVTLRWTKHRWNMAANRLGQILPKASPAAHAA